MNRYRLTPVAVKDLEEIADFIAADNPAAANRLIDRIEGKCQALQTCQGWAEVGKSWPQTFVAHTSASM